MVAGGSPIFHIPDSLSS